MNRTFSPVQSAKAIARPLRPGRTVTRNSFREILRVVPAPSIRPFVDFPIIIVASDNCGS